MGDEGKDDFAEQIKRSGIAAQPFEVTFRHVTRQFKISKKERLTLLDDISFCVKVCDHQHSLFIMLVSIPGYGDVNIITARYNDVSARSPRMWKDLFI